MENVFGNFLLNSGLYEKHEINAENISDLIALLDGDIKIDSYCTECDEKRIFSCDPIIYQFTDDSGGWREVSLARAVDEFQTWSYSEATPVPDGQNAEEDWKWQFDPFGEFARVLIFKYYCSLDDEHCLDYVVIANNNEMMKIGQYPSVADLSFPELKQYGKVASQEDMKELKRSIGLFAQGIGIGAYTYLRRIIERLIDEAGTEAIAEGSFTKEEYDRGRVADRIKLLEGYLPDLLVSNPVIYGILSRGIHELSEEKCLEYFPIIRECITTILEQREELRKKKESKKRIESAISKITSR